MYKVVRFDVKLNEPILNCGVFMFLLHNDNGFAEHAEDQGLHIDALEF